MTQILEAEIKTQKKSPFQRDYLVIIIRKIHTGGGAIVNM